MTIKLTSRHFRIAILTMVLLYALYMAIAMGHGSLKDTASIFCSYMIPWLGGVFFTRSDWHEQDHIAVQKPFTGVH